MGGKLTNATIARLGDGRHGDGNGLWLQVRNNGKNRAWLLTYTSPETAKVRQMGLGPFPLISLAEARRECERLQWMIWQRIDPLEQRRRELAQQAEQGRREKAAAVTFQQAGEAYIAAHRAGWRSSHARQWPQTLQDYVYPVLGAVPCCAVTTGLVLQVLQPIWAIRTETAKRIRARIEVVLDYAKAQGWRTGDNPAAWRGNLAFTLPARSRVAPVEHHAAMPWQDVPGFMDGLAAIPGTPALALQFIVLTACRVGEVLGMQWCEVDQETRVWVVPANRMKAGKEHRVPLSTAALTVLAAAARFGEKPGNYVFPGYATRRRLAHSALRKTLRRLGHACTIHGYRSSFRDWAGETTNHPREVVEMALAHRLGDKAEQSYARGDLFQTRRRLMDEWAAHCTARNDGAPRSSRMPSASVPSSS
jgi:integrase